MTHKEAQDYKTGLGLLSCISSVQNLTRTLSSSSYQLRLKVGLSHLS